MIPTTLLVRALLISRGHACWRHYMQTFPRHWSFMGGIHMSLVDCPKRPIMQSFDVFVAHGHNSPKWYPNVLPLVYRVYPISHCTGPRYIVNRLYSLYTASISSFLISWYLATPRHQYIPYWILGIIFTTRRALCFARKTVTELPHICAEWWRKIHKMYEYKTNILNTNTYLLSPKAGIWIMFCIRVR